MTSDILTNYVLKEKFIFHGWSKFKYHFHTRLSFTSIIFTVVASEIPLNHKFKY